MSLWASKASMAIASRDGRSRSSRGAVLTGAALVPGTLDWPASPARMWDRKANGDEHRRGERS
jgi:hypothetical protein